VSRLLNPSLQEGRFHDITPGAAERQRGAPPPLSRREPFRCTQGCVAKGWGEGESIRPNNMPKPKGHSVSPAILQRSRDFRHPLTPPEAKVWDAVRNRQLGSKIRRQHAIRRFIVDFFCAEARLAIETDGDTHAARDQVTHDSARTAWLEERGYEVIRFEAGEVGRNLAGVLEAIRGACEAGAADLR